MTLQLEKGKYYRTQDGRKVGPLRCRNGGSTEHPFDINHATRTHDVDVNCTIWTPYGRSYDGRNLDLVAEWTDEPAKEALGTLQFKPGDHVEHVRVKDAGIGIVKKVNDKTVVVVWANKYGMCTDAPEDLKLVGRLDEALDILTPDLINHPPHYTGHPSGVECIQITEHMNFCRGNAIKYIWRAGEKGNEIQDLKKARWYLDREIARLTQEPA